jgi:hypothetical protein
MKRFIPDFMKNRKNISVDVPDEADLLKSEKGYLEQLFNCSVEVMTGTEENARGIPWPGRPSIELIK